MGRYPYKLARYGTNANNTNIKGLIPGGMRIANNAMLFSNVNPRPVDVLCLITKRTDSTPYLSILQ
jgi:hypothetical protein